MKGPAAAPPAIAAPGDPPRAAGAEGVEAELRRSRRAELKLQALLFRWWGSGLGLNKIFERGQDWG